MIKVGIFFGGPSREREISFAGGRTVYDNLNKSLFEAIPLFIDSAKNIILLDWQYVYKGTIRDFYPPVQFLPNTEHGFQVYVESLNQLSTEQQSEMINLVGRKLDWSELPALIDFAFLALHGEFGEDGQIQGLLETLNLPYSGSGIRPSSIGMDKEVQKKIMADAGFPCPPVQILSKSSWKSIDKNEFFQNSFAKLGNPLVIRPANQGSSIGVSIINEKEGYSTFENAINKAFFIEKIEKSSWVNLSEIEKETYIRDLTDIRYGVGFPMDTQEGETLYHPEELWVYLEKSFSEKNQSHIILESHLTEHKVLLEGFLNGKEFSCIVIRDENGNAIALPPTEIVKGGEVFDYRSKYLAGLSRKLTPIQLPDHQIEAIRLECEKLFHYFSFHTYARIDGFINADGTIFLNDPNTTSGMLPSSFFFHQAAEIGLNPSQFLTYIVRVSIQERIENCLNKHPKWNQLLLQLDKSIEALNTAKEGKKKVAVIMGGYSFERHISVESGRNIYEKLASSNKYEPVPVFLTDTINGKHRLFQIPINLLLKDNADDIKDKILHFSKHPIIEKIKTECSEITAKYASKTTVFEPLELTYDDLKQQVDNVFIAIHGRPGEDGEIQLELEKRGIPYNGSDHRSSAITINKYDTLQLLKNHGFTVAEQYLFSKEEYLINPSQGIDAIASRFGYPFIAKPVDDGCSSAVKVIRTANQWKAYVEGLFRDTEDISIFTQTELKLKPKEEFPSKNTILVETLIAKGDAIHFMEITGGLLTKFDANGNLVYELFEPSEALSGGEVLSLEEKFLAGEGQNITPARFETGNFSYQSIAKQVKNDLERAARLLDVRGYARIDAFVKIYADGRVETIVIEVNSLPGMTPATCIFHQTAINGYKPYDFIDNILTFGNLDIKNRNV